MQLTKNRCKSILILLCLVGFFYDQDPLHSLSELQSEYRTCLTKTMEKESLVGYSCNYPRHNAVRWVVDTRHNSAGSVIGASLVDL